MLEIREALGRDEAPKHAETGFYLMQFLSGHGYLQMMGEALICTRVIDLTMWK